MPALPALSAHSTRARARVRLLAAAVLVLTASAALTGCNDGEGVRDEGPSSTARSLGPPCAVHAHAPRPAPSATLDGGNGGEGGGAQRSFCATSTAQ
ncbi:hypothetical protein ABZ858_28730 [Streptomyces sp. NPDC047017]|uniref:hypothetical protein n=1 Tax=Streptomyces sp. NPDC047017 TaxID=3155024 RepID=UPI0033CFBA34